MDTILHITYMQLEGMGGMVQDSWFRVAGLG